MQPRWKRSSPLSVASLLATALHSANPPLDSAKYRPAEMSQDVFVRLLSGHVYSTDYLKYLLA